MAFEQLVALVGRNDRSLAVDFKGLVERGRDIARFRSRTIDNHLVKAGNIDITSADALDVDALVRSLIKDLSSQLADDARVALQEIPTDPGAREVARDLARSRDLARDLTNTVPVTGGPTRVLNLARELDRLYSDHPAVSAFELNAILGSIIYVLLGVPYRFSQQPTTGDSSERLNLEVNDTPTEESRAAFTGRLESLIRDAEVALDQGRFDDDDQKRRQVERDLGYLRTESYETDADDFLGESLGAIVARVARNLASVTDIPDDVAPVINAVLGLMSRDQPDKVPDVINAVLQQSSIADPGFLASQDQSGELALQVQHGGPERWFAGVLGWIRSDHFGADVGIVRNSGAVGVITGSAIGLVVSAYLNNVVATSASAAAIGGIIGVALGWVAVRYRNRSRASDD